jgi:hypothetical protein
MIDELLQADILDGGLADPALEVDVLDDVRKRGITLFELAQCDVEQTADVPGSRLVPDVPPAGLVGYVVEAAVEVEVRHVGEVGRFLLRLALPSQVGDEGLAHRVELVGAALQEQHPEDVLLEIGCIHLAAQDVGRSEQVPFQLRQRQHLDLSPLRSPPGGKHDKGYV